MAKKRVQSQASSTPDTSEQSQRLIRAFERYIATHESNDWSQLVEEFRLAVPLGISVKPDDQTMLAASKWMRPRQLISLGTIFNADAQAIVRDSWLSFMDVLHACESENSPAFDFAKRVYMAKRALQLADILKTRFVESTNPARFRGDVYLTINGNFYFNYHELCGEFGMSKDDAIDTLYEFADQIMPPEQVFNTYGGQELVTQLFQKLFGNLECREAASLLLNNSNRFHQDESIIFENLPELKIRDFMMLIVARSNGFSLEIPQIQELYEICNCVEAYKGSSLALLDEFLEIFYADTQNQLHPSAEWLEKYYSYVKKLDKDRINTVLAKLLNLYTNYSKVRGHSVVRLTCVWMATHFDTEQVTDALVVGSTKYGSDSAIHPLSLIHEGISANLLAHVVEKWKLYDQANASHWTTTEWNLILRYFVVKQCSYTRSRLIDLYLRGGGYDEGRDFASVNETINTLFEQLAFSPSEKAKFANIEFDRNRLPKAVNVFNGEQIDLSEWASSSSAYKYVKTLLKLATEPKKIATATYLSEKRARALEAFLLRRDTPSSRKQIMRVCDVYENTSDARDLLALLYDIKTESPTQEWLKKVSALMKQLTPDKASEMLWELLNEDSYETDTSLAVGIMWAFRFVGSDKDLMMLARTSNDAGVYGARVVAALLDTLNAIESRTALLAILQLQRRVRNTKLQKQVQTSLDTIALREGLEKNIFLDYAVDTCELDATHEMSFVFSTHTVIMKLTEQCQVELDILDKHKHHLRSIPKNTREFYPELYQRFQAIKRLLTETVEAQKKRMNHAYKENRVWPGRDFIDIFEQHPVMQQVGASLIWQKLTQADAPKTRSKSTQATVHTDDHARDTFTRMNGQWCNYDGTPFHIDPNAAYKLANMDALSPDVASEWLHYITACHITQPFKQVKVENHDATSSPRLSQAAPSVKKRRK